jgi:hypothetical protein
LREVQRLHSTARNQIPTITQHFQTSTALTLTAFEQLEIMLASFTLCRRNDLQAARIHDHLTFERVSFLLTAVELTLLFLGRSIGDSATSTTTTSRLTSSRKARLLGKLNKPDAIKASSTRRTVRIAVVSWMPHSKP